MLATNRAPMLSRRTPTAAAVLKATCCVVIRTSGEDTSTEGAAEGDWGMDSSTGSVVLGSPVAESNISFTFFCGIALLTGRIGGW
jgi:hypothetical protein